MDNPAAPIPSTSPQPAVSSLPAEVLAKAGPAESQSRRWFLWLAGGLFILIIGIAIGLFGAKLSNQPSTQQPGNFLPASNSESAKPTPLPSEASAREGDPTANWKTYTNTEYGFSFKYPTDVFVYQGNPQSGSQYWSNKKDGGAPLELGQDGIWLNMVFSTNPGTPMIDFYNRIISLKTNEEISESAVTKISDLNTNNVRGAVYHQGIPPKFAGEPAYTYEAVWVKQLFAYRLSLSAFTEQNLQNNKILFDQILSTFHFLK